MYSELAVPAVQKAMHTQLIAWLINNSAWLLPIPALVYAAVLSDKVIKLQLAEILPRHQHLWCLVMPRAELRRHTVVVLSVCLSVTSISRRSLKTKS